MKKLKLSVSALFILFYGVAASAAPQWCYFNVDYIWVASNGYLHVFPKERGDHIMICNLDSPHQSISAAVCKTWFQTLTVASVAKKRVIIQYSDAPACTNLPTYGNTPAPYYIMLENP